MTKPILLTRPPAGQHIAVPSSGNVHFVLQFPADKATLERVDNSLLFTFEDGSRVELQDFYTVFSKNHAPDFVVNGETLTGADFFNAFGPSLLPAAGPAVQTAESRFHDWDSIELAGGITRLDGLDRQFTSTHVPEQREFLSGIAPVNDYGAGQTGETAPLPPPISPNFVPYTLRAVLHTEEAATLSPNITVDVSALGTPTALLLMDSHGNALANAPVSAAISGASLTLALLGNQPLETAVYCKVQFRTASGFQEKTIQITLDNDGAFTSATQDAADQAAGIMAPSGLEHGEWYRDNTSTGSVHTYNISSSNLEDRLNYDGGIVTGKIFTNDGMDTFEAANVGITSRPTVIDAGGGKDSITVNTLHGFGIANASESKGSVITGGGDSDSIRVQKSINGIILGDATATGTLGDDTISVGLMTGNTGAVIGDRMQIWSEAIGRDHIHIEKLEGGDVGGDVYIGGSTVAGAGNSIVIDTMTGGRVGGNTAYYTAISSAGVNDTITVKNLSGGRVAGDVGGEVWGPGDIGDAYPYWSYARGNYGRRELGGADTIHVEKMSGDALLSGDVGNYACGATNLGNDHIEIDSLQGGTVVGDAWQLGMGGSDKFHGEGGNDSIVIHDMTGGTVYGDARELWRNGSGQLGRLQAGDDSIRVDHMEKGNIFGDVDKNASAGVSHGNDTISIGELRGGEAKYIDGGYNTAAGHYSAQGWDVASAAHVEGSDVFIYDNVNADGTGHTLRLMGGDAHGNNAWVSIDNVYDPATHKTLMNTTICNFEGLGGGHGDDILYGNAGDNFLDGKGGHNTLYGGGGNDILMYHADDMIDGETGTDFLLGGEESLDNLLGNINGNNNIKNIEVVVTGPGANGLTNTEALKANGITVDADGKVSVDTHKGWTQSAQHATDASGNDFTVYSHFDSAAGDYDITIAIETMKLNNL